MTTTKPLQNMKCICKKRFKPKIGLEPLEGYENIMCPKCTFNALMKFELLW